MRRGPRPPRRGAVCAAGAAFAAALRPLNSVVRPHSEVIALFDKIPAHFPKALVFGVLWWILAAVLIGLAVLCHWVGFRVGYFVWFALLLVCIMAMFVCGLWFVMERVTGRVTPWTDLTKNQRDSEA